MSKMKFCAAGLLLLSGCIDQVYQPAPGVTPAVSAYRANLACVSIAASHPVPIMPGIIPTLIAVSTPIGQRMIAEHDRAQDECMAGAGYIRR